MSEFKDKLENLKQQQEQAKEIFIKCQGAIELIQSMLKKTVQNDQFRKQFVAVS